MHFVCSGMLAGKTGNSKRDPWQQHLLKATDADGKELNVRVFLRVEFQDGTRKAPTQDYHGSGRPHECLPKQGLTKTPRRRGGPK